MVTCIHVADVHIGMSFRKASFGNDFASKRRKEIKESFYNIIDRVRDKDFLFISGDLFEEENITIKELKEINYKFEQIPNTKILIISGNHDPIVDNKSNYRLINWADNVYIFDSNNKKYDFLEHNVSVYGISWNKKIIREELIDEVVIEDYNKINILLVHGDIYNKSDYLPISKDKLKAKGFDYVAMGHIHKHEFITERIAYCGSLEPLDFKETGEHGIIEGVVAKEFVDMKFMPMCKREFLQYKFKLTNEMMLDDIINEIVNVDTKENRSKNMYRIILEGVVDRDLYFDEYIIKDMVKADFAYIEFVDKTIRDYDLEKLLEENSDNIIGLYIKEMLNYNLEEEVNKIALYIGLEALINEKVK